MGNHVDGIDMEYTLDAWIKARDKLVQLDSAMSCGHARRYIYSANERAEITTSTCMMCALQSASARIAELEAERDAALTEAELHRVAMRRIVFAVFGRDLAEDEHTDVDSICEWIHGLRAENQNMLKRAEQAEADARALAERVFETEILTDPTTFISLLGRRDVSL